MRVCLLAVIWLALTAGVAHARDVRFAVLIGNNSGVEGETPLRYAESDALRVYEVLNQLGEFNAANLLLMRGQNAENVRSALIELNERIRDTMSQPNTHVVLVVYYSGHADSQALHLGQSQLPLAELRQLARGSAASFRLVVVDACRSGSLTRVKGGQRTHALDLSVLRPSEVPSDGVAFLTASSASEDAQESDELGSAFFTHAFVSGLFGAADGDRDGAVVLDEAYRYAYEATLRASSRTLVGAQHPTFHYDLRGRGQLVLTRPRAHRGQFAELEFPTGHGFLLLKGGADGQVVVEVERAAQSRSLTVEPGRYFVRARGPEVLYEGFVEARAGATQRVQLSALDRIDYARLVRKRGASPHSVHGLELGMNVRTALPNSSTACVGGFVGYTVDWSGFGARLRLSSCVSQLQNSVLFASTHASDASLQLYRAWDIRWFSFEVGFGAGLALFNQTFETRGRASPQRALAPFVNIGASGEISFGDGWYSRLGVGLESYWLRMIDSADAAAEPRSAFALRTSLGAGKQF